MRSGTSSIASAPPTDSTISSSPSAPWPLTSVMLWPTSMSCDSPSFFSGAEASAVSASWGSSALNSSPTVGTGSDALLVSSAASSIGASAPMVVGDASAGCSAAIGFGGDLDRQARVRHRLLDRIGRWRHLLGRRRHGLDFALGCAPSVWVLSGCALSTGSLLTSSRDAVACALPARVPAPGAMVGLGLGRALRALVLGDQRLPVGDRNLVVVGMDFAEGKKAVAIAAVVDEGGLQ